MPNYLKNLIWTMLFKDFWIYGSHRFIMASTGVFYWIQLWFRWNKKRYPPLQVLFYKNRNPTCSRSAALQCSVSLFKNYVTSESVFRTTYNRMMEWLQTEKPDKHCGSPSHLFNGYRGSFPGGESGRGVKPTTHLHPYALWPGQWQDCDSRCRQQQFH
jgi:hypothetical protein